MEEEGVKMELKLDGVTPDRNGRTEEKCVCSKA